MASSPAIPSEEDATAGDNMKDDTSSEAKSKVSEPTEMAPSNPEDPSPVAAQESIVGESSATGSPTVEPKVSILASKLSAVTAKESAVQESTKAGSIVEEEAVQAGQPSEKRSSLTVRPSGMKSTVKSIRESLPDVKASSPDQRSETSEKEAAMDGIAVSSETEVPKPSEEPALGDSSERSLTEDNGLLKPQSGVYAELEEPSVLVPLVSSEVESKSVLEAEENVSEPSDQPEESTAPYESNITYAEQKSEVEKAPEIPEPINYTLLRDPSMKSEPVGSKSILMPVHRVESIIQKYRDYRRRIVSLDTLESAASIALEELESESFGLEQEDITVEEKVRGTEESRGEDLERDPTFLDEFDELEVTGMDEEEEGGMLESGITMGMFLQEMEKKEVDDIDMEKEEEWSIDSEDEVITESDDDLFFYGKRKSISIELEDEEKKKKISETSTKSSHISYGPEDRLESFLSLTGSRANKAVYGSDYKFNFKFLWHARRKHQEQLTVDHVKRNPNILNEKSKVRYLLKNLKLELASTAQGVKKFKCKELDDGMSSRSEVEKGSTVDEVPCDTITEAFIREDIGPVLLDIAYDVGRQNLFGDNYYRYAGQRLKKGKEYEEPELEKIFEVYKKMGKHLEYQTEVNKYREYLEDMNELNIMQLCELPSNSGLIDLRNNFYNKKENEDLDKERDMLTIRYWLREQLYGQREQVSGVQMEQSEEQKKCELDQVENLYYPTPRRRLSMDARNKVDEIMKKVKELQELKAKEREEWVKWKRSGDTEPAGADGLQLSAKSKSQSKTESTKSEQA